MSHKKPVQSWITEVDQKVQEARDTGSELVNKEAIKTPEQDPLFLYEFSWQEFNPNSPEKKNTISSVTVNDYTKKVLEELKNRTGVSDRKRLTSIIEKGVRELASQLESGEIKGL
ncbi:hypothetical protein [Candidatus Enterovibrio escicola]|uniref:Uncharacterized protein n=1 Tax=Candidatus Enterovibrio escicola TaxID=1927127 RepID=A0A2A5T738_9GAMM|nr:hypothetical protein [Candidatus Enterovibrio escacola]PCS23948.1 hypothetical protein BTN49_0314 [Candidatus Enterovibrio escacola]